MTPPVLAPETLERVRTHLPTMTREETERVLAGVTGQVLARCATDIEFWLRFVVTRDEADPECPVKPFPIHKQYMRDLMGIFMTRHRPAIAKTRQMLVSWAICAYMVYRARFRPHQAIYYQTQNWPDAVKMIAMPGTGQGEGFSGRCQFIETHLPAWMQQRVIATEGRIIYPNASLIEAVPSGSDKMRGKTVSVIVLDEMAFLEAAKATYSGINPIVNNGAQLVMISTPNGADGNMFYHVWHGTPMTVGAAA